MKCLRIKDNLMEIIECDDIVKMMKEEFGGHYESTDWLIDENPDIRIFAGYESSLSDLEDSLLYKENGILLEAFKGTLFFGKNGIKKWRSLSLKDIAILKRRITKSDNHFEINY